LKDIKEREEMIKQCIFFRNILNYFHGAITNQLYLISIQNIVMFNVLGLVPSLLYVGA